MIRRLVHTISEYLRINAIKRMLSYVDVRPIEVIGLTVFAVVFAAFEGVGLSMLLPILQFAEGGQTAIVESSGAIWRAVSQVMGIFRLPLTLPVLLLMAFVPILIRQLVFYLNTWYSAEVAASISVRMRMQTLDVVLAADPEFFERHALGHIVGVVITQAESAGLAILSVVKQLSVALLMALYVAILFAISAPLMLVTVVFAGIVGVVVRANIIRIRSFGVKYVEANQQMMGKVVERFSMIRLVKLRDRAKEESERIAKYSEEMRRLSVRHARAGAGIEVTADPLLMLTVFVALYVGISALGMTLAQLGLVMFVLTRLSTKLKEFNLGRQIISQNMAGLLLVQELTQDAKAADRIKGGSKPFAGLEREIVIESVSFEYPEPPQEGADDTDAVERTDGEGSNVRMSDADKGADGCGAGTGGDGHGAGAGGDNDDSPSADKGGVLHNVSFTVPAGSFTALVGRSGGGKSTLVELLPRLREAGSGTITFDGTDIREFEVGSLRKGIGYLTQHAMLFNESVRTNLEYGLDYRPTEEQLRRALEGAYALFVYDLPQGLETKLGDRGVRLSGGERQRIGLARVLLEDSPLLILDEPTSALDSESESYIQKALAALRGKKTVIVIAHRLATVIQADQLVVIDEGRVVECGTHAELLERGTLYPRLFESQLQQGRLG
ncbi:MAG: ABC transporter ATP-binding protein/permease [Coriobacteriia bacterium]|nr:ABC transporter ATP-binding protein/permease [Coriobacteriia bacterium]